MIKRRFHIFIAMLVVLLAGSACVDEVEQTVYEYEPVKTEFAMFLPEIEKKSGRMMEEVVQPQPESFGMEQMYLFPFELKGTPRQLTSGAAFQGDNVLHSNNNRVESGNRLPGTNSVWFEDVAVPIKTNYFLMYGVQPKSASFPNDRFALDANLLSDAQKQGFQDGNTKTNLHTDAAKSPNLLSALKFEPAPIFETGFFTVVNTGTTSADVHNFYLARRIWVLQYLRGLLAAGTADNKWCNTANVDLKNHYNQWVGGVDGRNINASSKSILGMVEKLYRDVTVVETTVNNFHPTPGSAEETQKNKDLALITKIKEAITAEITATAETAKLKVQIMTSTPGTYPLQYNTAATFSDPNFPLSIGLPDGALQVRLIPRDGQPATVEFLHELRNEAVEDIYAYPAQQYYTARSEVGVSSKKRKEEFTGGLTWADFVDPAKGYFLDDHVYPYARTLVLKSPVTFGMANLSTKVRFKPGADNINGAEETSVSVTPLTLSQFDVEGDKATLLKNNITLTGVLVSDQREVGWDFTRESAAADPPSYMIYDRYLNAATAGKYQSKMFLTRDEFANITPNNTLLYPSKVLKAGENDRIFVILEFENGNQAFKGMGKALIPAHSRFYITYMMDARMLGLLDGEQLFSSANRVELQLTITGLSGAYNVLPDTRMIKVNLGIAAKITWENGFVFDDVPVGK